MATTAQARETHRRLSDRTSDMLAQWRTEYAELQEKHADLGCDYWQLQGQYSELQNQDRQIVRLLSPSRS